jgi:Mycoplasma protein of unknown function, DUF285
MNRVVVVDKEHLVELIKLEILSFGDNCSLNHLDVSGIRDMNRLFLNSRFNGDISKWDVSRVENMGGCFLIQILMEIFQVLRL